MYPSPGPPGGQLEPRQQLYDAQPGRPDPGHVADDDPGTGGFQQRPYGVGEPRHTVGGDGAGQGEYGGCLGVHVV